MFEVVFKGTSDANFECMFEAMSVVKGVVVVEGMFEGVCVVEGGVVVKVMFKGTDDNNFEGNIV